MGLSNIRRPEPELIEEYALGYYWNHNPGAGFSFPCDKDGNRIRTEDETQAADDNYTFCVDNPDKVTFEGIRDYSRTWRPDPEGDCVCGRTVVLYQDYGHGIDCECGRIYNGSGQELRPRNQWEERYDDDSTQPYCVEFGYVSAGDDY